MSELKPTDKGYIDALAKEYTLGKFKNLYQDDIDAYTDGYSDSLEHNNVPELIDTLKECGLYIREIATLGDYPNLKSFANKITQVLTKAEQNKLIK